MANKPKNMDLKVINERLHVYIDNLGSCEQCGSDIEVSGWHMIKGQLYDRL